MAVKLKFTVVEQKQQRNSFGTGLIGSVRLVPVMSGSDENKEFYTYTPGGQIEFFTINDAALKSLPVGAEVYVTLEVAPANA
jgi:hypothetical protein